MPLFKTKNMAVNNPSLSSSSEALSDMSADEGGIISKGASQENRITSLEQQNRVLKMELEMYKLRCKQMQEENKNLRQASVSIQAKAEQEEEFISNTLMKKINSLKKEKEVLAMNYEQEEEYLTNDLSKKLMQLRQEKVNLEQTLEREQEFQVNKLIRRIEKLEAETIAKQQTLEQLRKEKVDLENTLEQEQEALVNRLWIRMEKLETEKRMLQGKLDQPLSEPASPRKIELQEINVEDLSVNVNVLRDEVIKLRKQLVAAQQEHTKDMTKFETEEHHLREENVRLQRKLLLEMERREQLSRQLSESESSLEMDDERHFNELTAHGGSSGFRDRAISSPIPYPSPTSTNTANAFTPHQRPKSPTNVAGSSSSTHPTPPNSYTAFTPPSPLGSGRASSNSSTTGSSPPFIHKVPRPLTQSPKLPRKMGLPKERPLSGSISERQRAGHIRTSSNTSDRPTSGN